MNDEKFATLGEKLDVKTGELPNKKQGKWLNKAGFVLVQALVLVVSLVFGYLLGFTEHSYQSYYPFWTRSGKVGALGLISINLTNLILTAKRNSKVGGSMKRWVKIPFVLVNAILSRTVYPTTFDMTASSDQLTAHMMYGVYAEDVL
jgi:hypothetical protein